MSSWAEVEANEPEFARHVRARFDRYKHKVLATLRRDGSPRISGIEATFRNGQIWLGMMPGSLKARDLQRNPHLALHSGTEDPDDSSVGTTIDAKLSGRAIEVSDPEALREFAPGGGDPNFHLFKVSVDEVVLITVGEPADHLVIETWTARRGLRRIKRY